MIPRRSVLAALGGGLLPAIARAQRTDLPVLAIGVLTDTTGYGASVSGPPMVQAVRQAILDAGPLPGDRKVVLLAGSYQLRPDDAMAIATKWFDQGVAAIVDVPDAAAARAIQALAQTRGRTYLSTAVVGADLTGRFCSATGSSWCTDTATLARALVRAVTARGAGQGGLQAKSWFLVLPDTVLGLAARDDMARAIEASGGRLAGLSRHPPETTDFSSIAAEALASGAKAIALCDITGGLTAQLPRFQQAGLFADGRQVVALLPSIADIHAAPAGAANGLLMAAAFNWNENEQARLFSDRFFSATGRMPDEAHAAAYVAVRHFLSCVVATGTINAEPVVSEMRAERVYFFGRTGHLRLDGRLAIDLSLLRGKPAEAQRGEWDRFEQIGTISALDLYKPLNQSACKLVR